MNPAVLLTRSLVPTNSRSSRRLLLFHSCSLTECSLCRGNLSCWSFPHTSSVFLFLWASSFRPQTVDYRITSVQKHSFPLAGCHGATAASQQQRVGLITVVFWARASSVCVWTPDVMRIKNGDLHLKIEIILEPCKKSLNASSCCCVYSTRLVFFLLFSCSSFPSSLCWRCQSLCCCFFIFLMNYLSTPQCWLQCMSEHL